MRRLAAGFAAALLLGAALVSPLLRAQEALPSDPLEEAFLASIEAHGQSHASGARPELGPVILGNPTRAVVTLRIGLAWSYTSTGTYSEFATVQHPFVQISNTVATAHVIDRSTNKLVDVMQAGDVYDVRWHGPSLSYIVTGPGGTIGAFEGPILFKPIHAEDRFRIESIERSDVAGLVPGNRFRPMYRGAIEIARGPSPNPPAGRVNVVNIVELESYVPGVVANESIASFHMEALKAQAAAARGYAVANVGRYGALGFPFDIVDSSASQVYRGLLSEHPRAVQASAETRGLVASHTGRIISALYSASFGGHSESSEWIFPFPPGLLPGANITPYLHGVYDGEGAAPDFTDPGALSAFWTLPQAQTFDSCPRVSNRFARWTFSVPAATIKSRMLVSSSRSGIISGNLTGSITGVEVTERMTSGRVAIARVTFTTGVAEVRGWDNLRQVFGATVATTPLVPGCTGSMIGAGFVLNNPSGVENEFNADGTYKGVKVSGGGWGHNAGMSQYGAHGRARAGQTFLQILKSYYLGVDVGSYPIDIGRQPGAGPPTLRQEFFAPNARGVLEVRPAEPGTLEGLIVHLNETYDIVLREEALAAPVVRLDVSPYLLPGINVVQYNPVGRTGAASVTVIVD